MPLCRRGDVYDTASQEGSEGGAQWWPLHPEGASGREQMHLEGMSSHVAVANVGRPAAVKRAKIQFWEDGPATQRDYKMPEVTAKGTQVHCQHRSRAASKSWH